MRNAFIKILNIYGEMPVNGSRHGWR